MDGGRRILRSLSEALQSLGGVASDRLAFAGAGGAAYASAHPFAPLARQEARPVRGRRRSAKNGLLDFATRHGTAALVVSLLGTTLVCGAIRGGFYADFVEQNGQPGDIIARNIGFPIASVTVTGQSGLREAEVLEAAGIGPKNSLAFLDVAQVRERLRAVPLVRDASVRKLYPDRLLIELVERQPYALWQRDGQISVIAADGTVIDTLRDDRFAELPFVVGEGANRRLPEYLALIAKTGDLKAKIRAGVLVGGRRWTLSTTTGVEVMLPESRPEAALAALAGLERDTRILEKDVISLDLRLPGRLAARLSEEAAAQRADALARKNPRPKAGQT
jgi:cell division protein FtsQ